VQKENHGDEMLGDPHQPKMPYVTLNKSIQITFSQKAKCLPIRLLSLRERNKPVVLHSPVSKIPSAMLPLVLDVHLEHQFSGAGAFSV